MSAATPSAAGAPSWPALGHWVHGRRMRVCLTPTPDGLIHVYVAVPASALPERPRYGAHVNDTAEDALRYFAPGELTVDHLARLLRGQRAPAGDLCPGYIVGFELELEPDMVAPVAEAVRRCNTLARVAAPSAPETEA